MGNQKCGAFLYSLDRDPHPTCPRCRGKICTRDLTCDFCVGWSPAQWELFTKKRAYKDRKKSRPSGSVPPAPRAGTSSEVPQPGTSSSSSRSSGGQDRRGGGVFRVHQVLCPGRLPPLPLDHCLVGGGGGGGSVSGHSSVARERASVSAAPSGAGEGKVARSQRTPCPLPPARAASSVASPRSSQYAPFLDPPVFPDLRIEEQGRIVELALGRTALVTVATILALASLTVRGQEVESVGGGHPLGRCPPTSGCDLRIAPAHGACALALGRLVSILGSIPLSA